MGTHTVDIPASYFPDPTFTRAEDLYSMVVVDPQRNIFDQDRFNNYGILSGVTMTPDGTLYVAGDPFSANTVTLTSSTVTFNGTSINYDSGDTNEIFFTGSTEADTFSASGVAENILAFMGVGNDTYIGGSLTDIVYGGPGHDILGGGSGEDALFGQIGNDTLSGDGDADLIIGGVGNNTLEGGLGDDLFYFGNGYGTDTVEELSLQGNDTISLAGVTSDATFQLGSVNISSGTNSVTHSGNHIENFIGGSGDDEFTIDLTGNLAPTLTIGGGAPNASDNVRILGTTGTDTLTLSGNTVTHTETTTSVALEGIEHLSLDVSQNGTDSVSVAQDFSGALLSLDVTGGGTDTDSLSVSAPGTAPQSVFIDGTTVDVLEKTNSHLGFVETHKDGVSGIEVLDDSNAVVVTPDGKHVYVAAAGSDNAVAIFARNLATGALSFLASVKDGATQGSQTVDGLAGVSSLAVTPDGRHLYVSGASDNAIAVFSRDQSSGDLTFLQLLKDGVDGVDGLSGAKQVVASDDGKHVYAVGSSDNALAVFARDAASGILSFVEIQQNGQNGVGGLLAVSSLVISPDGSQVYATSPDEDKVATFIRNSVTGQLTFSGVVTDGDVHGAKTVSGLDGASSIAVSADGAHVYVTGGTDDSVVLFTRNKKQGLDIAGATGGSFKLSFGGQTTGTIAYNASSGDIQTALQAPSTIGANNVVVTGGPLPNSQVEIEFTGDLEFTASPLLGFDDTNLTTGPPVIGITGALTFVDSVTDERVNEEQRLDISGATGGSFKLSFGGQTTGDIAYNASRGDVQTALQALSTIGSGNVVVTGGPLPNSQVDIEFMSDLGYTGFPLLGFDDTNLTAGSPASGISSLVVGHSIRGLDGPKSIAISPDGTYVFVAGANDDAIAAFSRQQTTGQLVFVGSVRDAIDGVDGLDEVQNITVSPDGRHVYTVSHGTDNAVTAFRTPSHVVLDYDAIDSLSVQTGDADDRVTVQLGGGLPTAIAVDTGSSTSDLVTVLGTAADETLTIDGAMVSDGTTTVTLSGAENSRVFGSAGDDTFSVQLGSPGLPASITLSGGPPSASDDVTILGTTGDDTLTLSGNSVAHSQTSTLVALEGIEHLTVDVSQNGTDSVTAHQGFTGALLSLDVTGGGTGSDTLNATSNGAADQSVAIDGSSVRITEQSTSLLTFVEFLQDTAENDLGTNGAFDVTVSPDDKSVYAAGAYQHSLAAFTRNATDGSLVFQEIKRDDIIAGNADVGLEQVSGITVSPDGRHAYAAVRVDDAVAVYGRDPVTGALTLLESHFDGDSHGALTIDGLDGAFDVLVSSDGHHVYVAGEADDGIAVFERDVATGRLNFVGAAKNGVAGVSGLDEVFAVAMSPDGKHLYAASDSNSDTTGFVAVFARNSTTGLLSFEQAIEDASSDEDPDGGLNGAFSVTVSPDGSQVFVAARRDGAVTVFSRNSADGHLTFAQKIVNDMVHDGEVVVGLNGADSIHVSADGRRVYVAGYDENALAVFMRDLSTGVLTYKETHVDGGVIDGLTGPRSVTASGDGRNVYIASDTDDALAVFRHAEELSIGFSAIDALSVTTGEGDETVAVQLGAGLPASVSIDTGDPTASDTVTVTGTSTAEAFTVTGNSISDGTTTIALSNVESLTVESAGGEDVFDVTPSPSVPITIDGGDPGSMPGDTLSVDAQGAPANDTGTSVDVTGFQSVAYSDIESVNIVNAANDAPTLTAFADAVDTTLEDTEVELTFAELAAQGNEMDVDGTVTAFVVQAVSSGTLKIGSSAGSATAFNAATNNTIDATKKVYWTPASNVNGDDIAAFTVQARDNDNDLSATAVGVAVNVSDDNDPPTLTAFARKTPATSPTNADTLVFDITFNENVENVSADDFEITGTTATGTLAGSGGTYTLTMTGGDMAGLNGTVELNLSSGQDITDEAGNALPAGEPATDESYTVDNVAPRVIDTDVQQGDIVPAGALSVNVKFDDKLDASSLDTGDVTLIGAISGAHVPTGFNYNSTTSTLWTTVTCPMMRTR